MYKESLNNWKYINFKTNYIHKKIIFVHESIKFSQLLTVCHTKVVAQILYSHIFSNFTIMIKKFVAVSNITTKIYKLEIYINFNLWHPLLIITLYCQTKTSIDFLYRRRLNLKYLIQSSETLPIKLNETHKTSKNLKKKYLNFLTHSFVKLD